MRLRRSNCTESIARVAPRRVAAGVVAAALVLAVPGLASAADDPAATTTTTRPTTTATTAAPAVPAVPAPTAAAGNAPFKDSSIRATGSRAAFAAKPAGALPRPALTRGVPAEPVAGLAAQLSQVLTGGRAVGSVVDLRARLAAIVAARAPTATAAQLDAAWASAPKPRQIAVFTALAQVGKPYQFGSPGPNSFDCSGLTRFAWKAAGVDLPHNDEQQIALVAPRASNALLPGDLAQFPGHVSLYLGAGHAIVQAESSRVPLLVTDWSSNVVRWGSPI